MSNKLFVGNLSFNTTENDLQDAFAAHGTVTEANLMVDRMSGRPRGFGFVTMGTPEEAQKAVEAQKAQEAQKALEAQKAQEVKKPAKPVAPKPEQPKEARKEIVFEPVYFKIGSSELAPSEQAKLDAIAKTMQENPDVKVAVSGNTDTTGSRALNEKLADARAEVVKSYLIGKGVSGERLTTNGYAFDKPAAPNSTVRGRYLNRRTELDVVK